MCEPAASVVTVMVALPVASIDIGVPIGVEPSANWTVPVGITPATAVAWKLIVTVCR